VAAADALQPTVVLMDINMPKMNGIEATELIKARSPKRIVIGLSVNAGGANAEAMRQAGAAMLLTKEAPADDLYMAIHMTVNGGHQA
jgi:DNA-binding NarL/FixJ family response regulator